MKKRREIVFMLGANARTLITYFQSQEVLARNVISVSCSLISCQKFIFINYRTVTVACINLSDEWMNE
jgi:hypothetical protein